MHVNKSKLERNSSLEYYLMTFIEETKQVYLAVNQFFFLPFIFALCLVLDIVDILLGREEQLEEKEFYMPIFT